MTAPNSTFAARRRQILDYTPIANLDKGLRGWWLTPPRHGIYLVISPWQYRHLRFFGVLALATGVIPVAAGLICLGYGVFGWAAFFLVIAALAIGGGSWFLSIDRSIAART
jgi:hypothetical protein